MWGRVTGRATPESFKHVDVGKRFFRHFQLLIVGVALPLIWLIAT